MLIIEEYMRRDDTDYVSITLTKNEFCGYVLTSIAEESTATADEFDNGVVYRVLGRQPYRSKRAALREFFERAAEFNKMFEDKRGD